MSELLNHAPKPKHAGSYHRTTLVWDITGMSNALFHATLNKDNQIKSMEADLNAMAEHVKELQIKIAQYLEEFDRAE